MIACVDVAYHDQNAVAACVLFRNWSDGEIAGELVRRIDGVADYKPGEFSLRELPCVLPVLSEVREPLETVIVDGYVWLGREGRPGLGARVFDSLGRSVAVIGVAKSRFAGAAGAIPVVRGKSIRPLYVTAAGMDIETAARHIRLMHGTHRIPTLLKLVDQLSRKANPEVLSHE